MILVVFFVKLFLIVFLLLVVIRGFGIFLLQQVFRVRKDHSFRHFDIATIQCIDVVVNLIVFHGVFIPRKE